MAKDALTEIIHEAVKQAVAEQIAPLLAELKRLPPTHEKPQVVPPNAERFVSMTELCQRLGVNRSTVLRRERVGKLPMRKTFPDGRVGWTATVIDEWFSRAVDGTDAKRAADLIGRLN